MRYFILLMLLAGSLQAQTYMTNFMVEREIAVDSVLHLENPKAYQVHTIIEFTKTKLYIKNTMLDEELFIESKLSKNTFLFRNRDGQVVVVKIDKKRGRNRLSLISDKEYLFVYRL